jgi:hypothetical protein
MAAPAKKGKSVGPPKSYGTKYITRMTPAEKVKFAAADKRKANKGSEGPKKRTPVKKAATKDYPNTWRPKSASSEGPKKRTPAKKTTKKK